MQVLHPVRTSLFQRHTWLIGGFAVLMLLAGLAWVDQPASAATAEEVGLNGTLPPGGTIPPGGTVPPPNAGQIRVIHFAPFDPDIADTAVDICTEANQPVSGFTNLVYLSESGYKTFFPGVYDWKVTLPGCGAMVVDIPVFTLFRGARLTLNIIGDNINQPVSTILAVDDIGFPSSLYLPNIRRSA